MYQRLDLVKSILFDLYFKIYFLYVYLYLCECVWELVGEEVQMWELGTELWSGRAGGACQPCGSYFNTGEYLPWKIFQ